MRAVNQRYPLSYRYRPPGRAVISRTEIRSHHRVYHHRLGLTGGIFSPTASRLFVCHFAGGAILDYSQDPTSRHPSVETRIVNEWERQALPYVGCMRTYRPIQSPIIPRPQQTDEGSTRKNTLLRFREALTALTGFYFGKGRPQIARVLLRRSQYTHNVSSGLPHRTGPSYSIDWPLLSLRSFLGTPARY